MSIRQKGFIPLKAENTLTERVRLQISEERLSELVVAITAVSTNTTGTVAGEQCWIFWRVKREVLIINEVIVFS